MHLCLPKINSALQPTEILAEEKVEFLNGEFSSGMGSFMVFDLFDNLIIEFGNAQKIETENLSDGILEIDRNNADTNIWNPFILCYKLKEAQSPICLKTFERTIVMKMRSKYVLVDDLIFKINISDQSSRKGLKLIPNNLSHTAKYVSETTIVWKIEYPRYGSSYILEFTGSFPNFNIVNIEASYLILDELCSGLVLKKNILSKNNTKLHSIPMIKKSSIKEIITF